MSLQDPSHISLTPQPETHAVKPPVSERKILANRKNALRSTGPKTLRGKRTVSRNAIKMESWPVRWCSQPGMKKKVRKNLML